jgi:hypothetical protein
MNKLYEPFTLVLVSMVVVVLAITGYASWKYFGAQEDGYTEELCEAGIEQLTGADIDLSSDSPEVSKDAKK